jgi:predicted transcriptional regulator
MTKAAHARAPKGACRDRRRPLGGGRPAWVRPFQRMQRCLDASVRLIDATIRTYEASQRHAHHRPIGTSLSLTKVSGNLTGVTARLRRAALAMAKTSECIAREPEVAAGVPQMLFEATARWLGIARWLAEVADGVFTLHEDVLAALRTGQLIPERSAFGRRRIAVAPRPSFVRAFLLRRQPRAVDRIASILRRRRRTPRPAALRVPRRSVLGRAPPLSSICLL